MKKSFVDAFVEQMAKLSASAIFGLITAMVLGAASLVGWVRTPTAVLAGVILLGASFAIFWLAAKRVFVVYPRTASRFVLKEKCITYRLAQSEDGSQRTITYRKRFALKSLTDDLHGMRDIYRWTGSNSALPVLRDPSLGCSIVDHGNDSIWNTYEVRFAHPLGRNETIEFELEWILDDSDRSSQSFFSTAINEPTERVSLQLELPEHLRVGAVWLESKRSIDSTSAFASEDLLGRDGRYVWSCEDPPRYRFYCLRWRESDESNILVKGKQDDN